MALYHVWFHGEADVLPRPTKVSVINELWDVDDLKDALVSKARLQFGAPSFLVKRAVMQGFGVYLPVGEALHEATKLKDASFSDLFIDDAHFFVQRVEAAAGKNGRVIVTWRCKWMLERGHVRHATEGRTSLHDLTPSICLFFLRCCS
jgi:hypothetical protein